MNEQLNQDLKAIAEFSSELVSGKIKDIKAHGGSKRDIYTIPVENLHEFPGFNMRLSGKRRRAHIDRLKALIKANGYQNDSLIRGYIGTISGETEEKILVRDGYSRREAVMELNDEFDAAQAAGEILPMPRRIDGLPVIFADQDKTMLQMTVANVTANNGNEPYTMLELALACQRLRTVEDREPFQIAEALGYTEAYVKDLLMLATAPKSILAHVEEGNITGSVAITTIKSKKGGAAAAIDKAVARIKGDPKDDAVGTKIVSGSSSLQDETFSTERSEAQRDPVAEALAQGAAEGAAQSSSQGAGAPDERGQTLAPTATQAAEPKPRKEKKRVTAADIDPMIAVDKEQKRMAARLFAEVERLIKEGVLKETPELEKILFNVESLRPAA
ncbi:hypothetical protein Lumi_059 [Xylophilus phage Lumi]|nr:hypothetical protein Lumi_059 [Xylophilus phage Lumi]